MLTSSPIEKLLHAGQPARYSQHSVSSTLLLQLLQLHNHLTASTSAGQRRRQAGVPLHRQHAGRIDKFINKTNVLHETQFVRYHVTTDLSVSKCRLHCLHVFGTPTITNSNPNTSLTSVALFLGFHKPFLRLSLTRWNFYHTHNCTVR